MRDLIAFAGIMGTLAASVLISFLIGRLTLEAFFRMIAPRQRVTVSQAHSNPWQLEERK